MSVARRFEFVIGPFLIIDLAKSGSLFCGSGPFPPRWPLLNFAVALEIDLNQSIL
jgi:hypothetical protein